MPLKKRKATNWWTCPSRLSTISPLQKLLLLVVAPFLLCVLQWELPWVEWLPISPLTNGIIRVPEFSPWAEKAQSLKDELLYLVDADTDAFNLVLEAMRMPKGTEAEKAARAEAIETANKGAAQIPFRVMETAFQSYELLLEMAKTGLKASITDAGVGALCTHTGIVGAGLNARINLGGIKDAAFKTKMREDVARITAESEKRQKEVMAIVESKMG